MAYLNNDGLDLLIKNLNDHINTKLSKYIPVGGEVSVASKLGSETMGSSNRPIYLESGSPAVCAEMYTVDEINTKVTDLNTAISGKANATHSHDDLYYTESEINTKISDLNTAINSKADTAHSHDNLYYTESEIDKKVTDLNTAISGKAPASHTHNDLYYTESEINTKVSDLNTAISGRVSKNGDTMNGDLIFNCASSADRYITFDAGVASTKAFDWRIGYLGSGADDANYLVFQSSHGSTVDNVQWTNALRLGLQTFDATFAGDILPASGLTKNLGSVSRSFSKTYTRYIDTPSNYDLRLCSGGNELLTLGSATGNLHVTNHIIPKTNATSDLGSSDTKWHNIFASNFVQGKYFRFGSNNYFTSDISSSFKTSLLGQNTSEDFVIAIRPNNNTYGPFLGNYASMLAWGVGDTHGFIQTSYNDTKKIKVGGGGGDKINWTVDLIHSDNYSSYCAPKTHTHDDRYYTESEIDTKVTDLNTAINGKAPASHSHDDRYYTESEINTKVTDLNTAISGKAPLASPTFTGTPKAPTANMGTNTTQIATTAYVKAEINSVLTASNAMVFKGTLGTGGTTTSLPASHSVGDTYKVITAGTYAGNVCNVGDLIICITDGTTANNAHWTVVESNQDGMVTGPASSVDGRVAVFSGTSGKVIKDSGYTIAKSVPSDAKFTDTVYTHPTSAGNKHIPSGGATGNILLYGGSSGTASWSTLANAGIATTTQITDLQTAVNGKAPTSHTHDDRYYTESEINTKVTDLNTAISGKVSKSGDTMTGNLTFDCSANAERFIQFNDMAVSTFNWRIGYLGSGGGDANYLAFQSSHGTASNATSCSWTSALQLGLQTFDATFAGNILPAADNTKYIGTSTAAFARTYTRYVDSSDKYLRLCASGKELMTLNCNNENIQSYTFLPKSTDKYYLGSVNYRWLEAHVKKLYGSVGSLNPSTMDKNHTINYIGGQREVTSTPTADKIYVGSSSNNNVVSVAKLDGSSTVGNVMNIRVHFNTAYYHDIGMYPNDTDIYHRAVVNGNAHAWKKFVLSDMDDNITGTISNVKITPNSDNVACELWFCDSSRTLNKGTITYDNDLRYNPSTNQLMLGNMKDTTATPTTANVVIDGANKKISVGSSFIQYNSTTGCLEITA